MNEDPHLNEEIRSYLLCAIEILFGYIFSAFPSKLLSFLKFPN